MDGSIIIEALVQVARKRRLLSMSASARLGDYARQKGVANLDDLRTWLAAGDGLSAHLANELLGLVPKAEQKPLGGYIPVAHLADGGMGTVWLACSPANQLVVVKTLKKASANASPIETSHAEEFFKRFDRESRFTQQLTHPNIVRCLDSGVGDDHTPYMVLEYVDSGDLKDLVERRAGLQEGLALAIFYQVNEGLIEANRLKLVHRDIKPPNIFVSTDGRARLADFGIARSTESTRTMLTMEGALVGSPMYMSPEQIVSDPDLDIRSDIYAMGAVLYYCLAAAPPFDGRLQEVLHKHCTASVPDIRALRPVISEGTGRIIATCMQKERGKRYKDPSELGAAVANVLVKLGLKPGAPIDEDTRQGDLSGAAAILPEVNTISGRASASGVARAEQATIAMNLGSGTPAPGGAPQETMAMDLLSADQGGGRGIASAEAHTIAANLLAEDLQRPASPLAGGETMATRAGQAGISPTATMATVVAGAPRAAPPELAERLDGDLATAIQGDWVSLLPNAEGDPAAVLLFARTRLCVGRLREPPTDLCLRNYPVSANKEACQRASRQHLNLQYEAITDRVVLEDLKSPNGTMLDGITIKPGQSCPIEGDSIVVVAGVMSVWLKPIANRAGAAARLEGASGGDAQGACGIDKRYGLDALAITRPENRPELAYAMVLRQIAIGGPGADLVLAGARTRTLVQVGHWRGRWIWRAGRDGAWKPLASGATLDCGGKALIAQVGAYPHF